MTSATPAPSQIAPWIASSIWFLLSWFWFPSFGYRVFLRDRRRFKKTIWFLLSWFWFPSFGYRVFLRDRRRFKKTIMMPPATIHMPACRIVSVVIVCALLLLFILPSTSLGRGT